MYSLMDLITAPWRNSVVTTAVRLNVFSILAADSMTVHEIASRCGANPEILKHLLDACVSMELLAFRDGKYANSLFSRTHLVEGESSYVGDLIKLQHHESSEWDRLFDILVGGGDERVDKEHSHGIFIRAMHNLGGIGEADALCDAVDLAGRKRMVDVGGGSGIYSIALCRKFPGLHSTILDRRETLVVTKEITAGCEERSRITLREADISKDSYGQNADVVLLSDVVYDEAAAAKILGNARRCLKKDGLLIIRGYYSDPEKTRPLFGALFVLGQLVFDPDRKILTLSSLHARLKDIGFSVAKMTPLTERSFVIISELK
jgi:predicted nicotinamide N-methyase